MIVSCAGGPRQAAARDRCGAARAVTPLATEPAPSQAPSPHFATAPAASNAVAPPGDARTPRRRSEPGLAMPPRQIQSRPSPPRPRLPRPNMCRHPGTHPPYELHTATSSPGHTVARTDASHEPCRCTGGDAQEVIRERPQGTSLPPTPPECARRCHFCQLRCRGGCAAPLRPPPRYERRRPRQASSASRPPPAIRKKKATAA